jgi:hypothetical protein
LKRWGYWLAALIGVVIGVALMLVQRSTKKTLPLKSNHPEEFYAWEKTEDGQYRQVKKSYFMDETVCKSVISTLNEMSTKQRRSNWILSHTTESTFECWPADRPPFLVEEIESPYSDDDLKIESGRDREQPKLSATELFDLRTKCAACVEKVVNNYWPPEIPGIISRVSASHYDLRSGRCFVELKAFYAPPNPQWAEASNDHLLFDGQTGKELAQTIVYKSGTRTGVVHTKSIYDFVGTEYYIKKMMGEDAVK